MRRNGILLIVGTALACAATWVGLRTGERFVPVPSVEGASALAANFVRFAKPPHPAGVPVASGDPRDPVTTIHWEDEATLEVSLVRVLEEAERRRLDGTRREEGRRAALDLVFASTHSARVPVPGPGGERVGEIVVDRSRPSPARAGLQAVLGRLAERARGRFPHVRVRAVFLLSCGSWEDADDHRLVDRAIRALTGAPPELLLATSDKVNPDYRDIVAGFATGEPFTIYDCRPDGDSPRAVPWLRVARGGRFHFGTGEGVGLERPARWE